MEVKFEKNRFDRLALEKPTTIKLKKEEIITSHPELQIAFKEAVLKSEKDIEDARHIRNVAKEHLNKKLIQKYKVALNGF